MHELGMTAPVQQIDEQREGDLADGERVAVGSDALEQRGEEGVGCRAVTALLGDVREDHELGLTGIGAGSLMPPERVEDGTRQRPELRRPRLLAHDLRDHLGGLEHAQEPVRGHEFAEAEASMAIQSPRPKSISPAT